MPHISQKASSSLSRLTKESTIGTLWQQKQFLRIRNGKNVAAGEDKGN